MGVEITLLALSLVTSAPASGTPPPDALPFGISQQRTPSTLGCRAIAGSPDSTGQYVCDTLPRPNVLFEEYVIAYVKGFGICNVVGISPYNRDDRRGTETRRLFRKASEIVSSEFGPPDERVDYVSDLSAQREDSFRSAIISEERQVFHQWNGLSRRFKNMESASLTISGSDELGLAIYGVYRFAGNDQCLRQMERITGLSPDE
ncbi:hypothetical protein [Rhizobium ruizarguesonis]|uniref:hypothetical protein n=1 Tax=Rhizobium ruizarguesonis TaxID=2081791 RepID=UPI0013BF7BEE|nr:hypothetical protein [Rhizobium ruizarguesonis]NEJ02630.1 hypothetical protein [Rhizobium ruizarguesonis]NEJ39757.1 hypothetical protein [Rhizobium ruizarguesonis]